MKDWFSKSWKKYYTTTYRILAFIVAIAVVTYLLPKTGKFRYEYTKGRPWMHSTLIAPFDFPIFKSTEELSNEKDSLLNSFRPYFVLDTSVQQQQIAPFIKSYNQTLVDLQSKYPKLFRKKINKKYYTEIIRENIIENLQGVYRQGIISLPEQYLNAPPTFELYLIKGNLAEPYGLSEFSTQKAAYQTIMINTLNNLGAMDNVIFGEAQAFLSDIQLNKYIHSNIIFDKERTEIERQNLLKNISLTGGKVIAGQRIIDTGEIIDGRTVKILDSLKKVYEERLGSTTGYYLILIAQTLIITLFFIIIYLFLFYFRVDVYHNLLSVSFILMMVILMVALASGIHSLSKLPLFIIPFAILPIIIRIFFDSRLALFLYIITILISAFFASNSFLFVLLQIPAGIVAIFSLFRMVRRSQLVRAALFIFLTYSLFYAGISLWQEGDILKIDPRLFGQFAINAALILLAYPLIDIFERTFRFLSDVTLMELSDTNHPLLRMLAEKAPGTFQHSIQVANLAQEVAYKIGANPMLVRAGAMYHDIGKTVSPIYFTENQAAGLNPHADLDFEDSAKIIIDHIENGVKLARKEKLPEQIIDFIRTHQGTTKTKFFYNSYVNKHPDIKADPTIFTYPGPTPFTKETAIVMMADAIEATSKSLKNYTDEEIDNLVENIINTELKEEQFRNAPITFKEITQAKEVLKLKLKSIYHARIEYPSIKKRS
jgi:putative nucleotidyltransferase with HDIG domain